MPFASVLLTLLDESWQLLVGLLVLVLVLLGVIVGAIRFDKIEGLDPDNPGDTDTLGLAITAMLPPWWPGLLLPGGYPAVMLRITPHPDGWDWRPFESDDLVGGFRSSLGPIHGSFRLLTEEQILIHY